MPVRRRRSRTGPASGRASVTRAVAARMARVTFRRARSTVEDARRLRRPSRTPGPGGRRARRARPAASRRGLRRRRRRRPRSPPAAPRSAGGRRSWPWHRRPRRRRQRSPVDGEVACGHAFHPVDQVEGVPLDTGVAHQLGDIPQPLGVRQPAPHVAEGDDPTAALPGERRHTLGGDVRSAVRHVTRSSRAASSARRTTSSPASAAAPCRPRPWPRPGCRRGRGAGPAR